MIEDENRVNVEIESYLRASIRVGDKFHDLLII